MTYTCPYSACEWEPSRPIESDCRLTQVVVAHEIRDHREQHRKDRDGTDRQSLRAEVGLEVANSQNIDLSVANTDGETE